MSTGTIVLIIVIVIAALLTLYIVSTYNKLVRTKNTTEESFSTMDVYLKKRWDLIPNVVETVKGYAKHEQETFAKVVELRSKPYESMSTNEKIEANNQLTQGLSKIIALAENYPALKADSQFSNLTATLTNIEADIASSRKYYNGSVKNMNNMVQVFPSNIVAKMFSFKTFKMFEINETERQNVKVQF